MLTVSGLNVFHANLQVVWDLSFHVNKGELVTMIGPNGAGKTTTVETIIGLNRNATGSILFDGENILGQSPVRSLQKRTRPGTRETGDLPDDARDREPPSWRDRQYRPGQNPLTASYRLFPDPAGTGAADGRHALRRRTADACHRPCAHVGTTAPHP